MKFRFIVILTLGILLLVGLKYLFRAREARVYLPHLSGRLATFNDSLRQSDRELEEKILLLEKENNRLCQQLLATDQKIKQIQASRYEKIQRTYHLNHHQLFQFFAKLETDSTAFR